MKHSVCPGATCKYYHVQDDYNKYDQERGVWYKFTAYFCKCPALQIGRNGEPRKNRQVPGGSPIGYVVHNCRGKYAEVRS